MTTSTGQVYSFGQILMANLADADVQTQATDYNLVALDLFNAFSGGALGTIGETIVDRL
jgi:hypothetical protein